MEKFSPLSFDPFKDGHCDITVEKPTFFMKLDAGKSFQKHHMGNGLGRVFLFSGLSWSLGNL